MKTKHRIQAVKAALTKVDLKNRVYDARVRFTTCCGMCELYNLQEGPQVALASLAAWQKGYKGFSGEFGRTPYQSIGNFKVVVVFTDATYEENGIQVAEYIKANKLGDVVTIKPNLNSNSGNMLQAWLWSINRKTWKKWVEDNVIFPEREHAEDSWLDAVNYDGDNYYGD